MAAHPTDESQHEPESAGTLSRRRFLNRVAVFGAGATAALVGLPVIGFLFAPMLREKPQVWRQVGAVDSFAVGRTVLVSFENAAPLPWAGLSGNSAAWLRRINEQDFVAYTINCTHLDCPITWEQGAELFLCPCHGGVYYSDGTVAAGPPPRPLPTYPVRVRDGQVEIQPGPVPIS